MQSAKERFAQPMPWTESWTNRPSPRIRSGGGDHCNTSSSNASSSTHSTGKTPWAEVTRAIHFGRAKEFLDFIRNGFKLKGETPRCLTTLPSFLSQLAQQVIDHPHPERCLVIRQSAGGAEVERSYAALMDGPGWLPTVHTLGAAIQHHTAWVPLDGMEGLALLYSLWKDLPAAAGSGPRTFDAFMPWPDCAARFQ